MRIERGQEVTALPNLPDADLIVACDGVNSQIRQAAGTFPTDVRQGTNKYVWLGTSKVFGSFVYSFVRTDSGWVWAYAYGVDAESSTFIRNACQERGPGLAWTSCRRAESLTLLEKLFERQLDGHQLTGRVDNGTSVRWLSFRTITSRHWHDGRIVLVGDAAHTTHYSIGSGTKLAIEDVITLAECCGGTLALSGRSGPMRSSVRPRFGSLRAMLASVPSGSRTSLAISISNRISSRCSSTAAGHRYYHTFHPSFTASFSRQRRKSQYCENSGAGWCQRVKAIYGRRMQAQSTGNSTAHSRSNRTLE